MNQLLTSSLTLMLLLFLSLTGSAQVVINEYSASNLRQFTDEFNKSEDWIELHNASDQAVDVSGWHLSDKESKPMKFALPTGTSIPARGHLLIICSGRDLVQNGEIHSNFKLTQTKDNEVVQLADATGTVVDMRPMGLALLEHAQARMNDGDATWMVSTNPTPGTENMPSSMIEGYTSAPELSLTAGFYSGAQTVSIVNTQANSTLHYTLNGSTPTASSPVYSAPLQVTQTQVVKALSISMDAAILPGKVAFASYFIDESFSLPVFSVAADSVINLANGAGEIRPIGSLEYFEDNTTLTTSSYGSLNRHGQDSWVLDHRSLDWVSRDEMGYSSSVKAPIFSYSDRDSYQKFMFRNSGDDNYPAIDDGEHEGATHIRDEYVHALSLNGDMKLDQRAVERVILFLNGEYWGLYGMRERPVDHDYTDEYYDQGKYDIQYLTTWDETTSEYGGSQSLQDWGNLRDYILNNDMSVPENYEVAADSLNMNSLVDFFLLNLNTVAADWLNYNTGWWRGLDPEGDHKKWGYIVWDLDATFDYYINYTGVPNTGPDALVCDIEEISVQMDDFFSPGIQFDSTRVMNCPTFRSGLVPYPSTDSILQQVMEFDSFCCENGWDGDCQDLYNELLDFATNNNGTIARGNVGKHEKIFLKLIEENAEFKQLYYSRYADLMNTVFSCENMTTTLDSMLATIEPEMPQQIQRWGGTMTEWESNVDDLKEFINTRCDALDTNLPQCYNELSGPFEVTLLTSPPNVGEIDFNSLDIESFPWSGQYYAGMENNIKAKVFDSLEDQYRFSHWETRNGSTISPDVNERRATLSLAGSDTLIAVFDAVSGLENSLAAAYSLEVYPNPTNSMLNVDFSLPAATRLSFSILSVYGQQVAGESIVPVQQFKSGQNTVAIDLQNIGLTPGLYVLQVTTSGNQGSVKFTVF
ncbi:MAG: CotH kinase family protein [Saprospiraceae bacterium]